MAAEHTGWVNLPLHMQGDAMDKILRSNLSEPALRHASEVVSLGYTVIPGVVSPQHCRRVIAEFERFYTQNAETFDRYRSNRGILPRFTNLHMALPVLSQLFTRNPVLLEVQDFFFGRPTSLYTSLYYERGSEQPLHRDTPVFCTRPEYNYFGNTLYLDGANDENGCLEVLAGGHRVGELDREAMAMAQYGSLDALPQLDDKMWNDYQKRVVDRCLAQGLKITKLHMNAGDCLIWHPQLPHGGSPIQNMSKTRHSFVFHTAPVGARVYHQHVFFNPTKPFPEMAGWDQQVVEGRAVVHHPQGIAFGHPAHQSFKVDELNRADLTEVPARQVSTVEALRMLAPEAAAA
jgi:phytanoyl-CoA hydroxylase